MTAQMVADRLSYSEPKALRYQLNRVGFRNFTEFRNAVLSGAYLPQASVAEDTTPSARPHADPALLALPLAVRITAAGEPLFGEPERSTPPSRVRVSGPGGEPLAAETGATDRVARTLTSRWSRRAFCFVWRGESYDPYLRPGAVLIVDPAEGPAPGELILAVAPEAGLSLWRRYRVQDGWLLVHPSRAGVTVLPGDLPHIRPVGAVIDVLVSP